MLDMVKVIFLRSKLGCISWSSFPCSLGLDINQTVVIISSPIRWIKSCQNNKLPNEKGCRVRQWSIFSTDKLEDGTSEAWINTWGILFNRRLKIRIFVLLKTDGRASENRNTKKQMWQKEQDSPCVLDRTKILIYYVISAELY